MRSQGGASQNQETQGGMVGGETCEPEEEKMGEGGLTTPKNQALRFSQQEVSLTLHP